MATFAIGDVHGCFATLLALLTRLPFDAETDRLWLVGDLVNRGPASLEVLRWAHELEGRMGSRFQCVMGNHDLHLLAVAEGLSPAGADDSFADVLAAPDKEELLRWLDQRPLLVRDDDWLLVHAGLLPTWTPEKAEHKARKLERALHGPHRAQLLQRGGGPFPASIERRRQTLTGLTRLRTCTRAGEPCRFSGPPEQAPPGCLPWFEIPGRMSRKVTVVFGHWAALGLRLEPGLVALDSGCAWGNELSAVRLDDLATYVQPVLDPGCQP